MAWGTPPTFTVAEKPTAAKFNTIRDDLTWLHDEIPAVGLLGSADQTIANATWTTLTTWAEVYDQDAEHDAVTNPSRITTVTAGKYLFVAQINFKSASNTVALGARLLINGLTGVSTQKGPGCSQDGNGPGGIFYIRSCAAADFMELQVWQNSGGNLDTHVADNGCVFGATRL